jgi:hypothetical protein
MMPLSRLPVAVLGGLLFLSLAACSDPASVGSTLGPDSLSGGDPEIRNVVPTTLDTSRTPPLTGFREAASLPGQPGGQQRSWRMLTGEVDDPIGGVLDAEGYIDFRGTASRPSGISDAPVDSLNAELRLTRTYLHGDTTSTLEVQLFDLAGPADMGRAPADTSFATEAAPIRAGAYTVSPTDTLVTLPLPSSWIEKHQTALQDSTSFPDGRFDGFRLTTTAGNAVVGFEHGSATLRLTTSSDTVDFESEQTFTHIERSQVPPSGSDRRLLQAGVGVGLEMDWAGGRIDSLADANTLLNRVEISVPVDTTLLAPTDPDFVRPLPTGYRILASRTEGALSCRQLNLFAVNASGSRCVFPTVPAWVPGEARVNSDRAFPTFDQWFTQEAPLTRFRAEVVGRASTSLNAQETARRGLPSTVPVLVKTEAADPDALPRAILTVTPL